jgi:hypothetical protein
MKLETTKFLLYPFHLLPVGCHAVVAVVQFSHCLIHDELSVSSAIKPLNLESRAVRHPINRWTSLTFLT